jgi:hypothetical protein
MDIKKWKSWDEFLSDFTTWKAWLHAPIVGARNKFVRLYHERGKEIHAGKELRERIVALKKKRIEEVEEKKEAEWD